MVAGSAGEVLALVVTVAVAAVIIVRATGGRATKLLLVGALLVAGASAALLRPKVGDATASQAPGRGTAFGYVSSSACLACHPSEHASFRRTYHRTMTQLASPASVLAPLDARVLELDGRSVRLERRDDQVWATLPDPDAVIAGAEAPDVTRRVVLTTGSHREQAFWVAGERPGDLRLVPFVWLVKEGAFVARRDAFITPPGAPLPAVRWGSNCIACHAVAGEPRHDPVLDTFDTRTAELGVACEACHGPGAAHVERHRDPVERYVAHASKRPDPTIVHPGRLAPERSAAVCGQCHAYAFPRDEHGWWTEGYSRTFRAGDALAPSRALIAAETMGKGPSAPRIDAETTSIFWSDGAVRVGGREYNGLVASPCWERGHGDRKMTCLSCHAMHSGDPAGQVAPDRAGDRGCTTCHEDARSRGHSHHADGTAGSACVSCHMPKTSYALLAAVRSHRIDSPSVASTVATGRPNACNLCHLDRTLAWTSRWLSEWYGRPPVALPDEHAATGVHDGIAGDAGVRALIADALGTREALAATGGAFAAPLLREMRRDPYAAVRFIAERSLRSLPATTAKRSSASLVGSGRLPDGELDPEIVRALRAGRDERAVTIAE